MESIKEDFAAPKRHASMGQRGSSLVDTGGALLVSSQGDPLRISGRKSRICIHGMLVTRLVSYGIVIIVTFSPSAKTIPLQLFVKIFGSGSADQEDPMKPISRSNDQRGRWQISSPPARLALPKDLHCEANSSLQRCLL